MNVLLHVDRALFRAPENWGAPRDRRPGSRWSRPFRRRLRLLDLFVVGEFAEVRGLPVHKPLPFGRTPNVYRVKATSVEGDSLVVHIA